MTGGTGGRWAPDDGAVIDRAATLPPAPSSVAAALGGATPPDRFVQLTYTSFHGPDGRGGRQVKERSGPISAAEQQALVKRATGPDVGKLDRFLTPEQVDALPRRFVYGPAPGAGAAYWHSVPAGVDSSNRPGNVFAHIVLDREPTAPVPPFRPSDLLRSPIWLRPFGEEDVLGASLAGVPDPGDPRWNTGGHGRADVLEFLRAHALVRPGALSGLLDAVYTALERPTGPGAHEGLLVVLGVEDMACAQMWVAAVCHLMSPGTSRQLHFSTTERASRLDAARDAGLHLIVVPCADLEEIPPDDTVVLISDEDLAVDFVEYDEHDEAQAHTTRYGSRIPVTPWSTIATAVVREQQLTGELLVLQDEIAEQVADIELPCGWPLAMAIVSRALEQQAEIEALDYAVPAATALIVREKRPPSGVRPGTPLYRIDRRVRENLLGRTTAEAWAAVTAPRRPGDDRTFATNRYLERAVHDAEWLCRAGGVPLPDPPPAAASVEAEVMAQARTALERLGTAPGGASSEGTAPGWTGRPEEVVQAFRLLDLAVRSGMLDAPTDRGLVDAVLDRHAGTLWGPDAVDLLEKIETMAEPTQAGFVRPWFDARLPHLPGPPGSRLLPALNGWLFTEPPEPPSPDQLTEVDQQPATLVEAVLSATMVLGDPSRYRGMAAAALLGAGNTRLDRIAQGFALPITEVEGLLARHEPRLLLPLLRPALLAAHGTLELDRVVGRVRKAAVTSPADWDTTTGRAVQDAAELRALEMEWIRQREGHDRWRVASRFATLLRPLLPPAREEATLPDDLVESGLAADVVSRVLSGEEPDGPPLALGQLARGSVDDEVVLHRVGRRVADAAACGIVADLDLVLAAQLPLWNAELRRVGRPGWASLAEVPGTVAGHRLLDHVVWVRVSSMWLEKRTELVNAVRQAVHKQAGQIPHLDPRQVMHEYDTAAVRWWRMIHVGEESLGALLKRHW